MSSYMDVSYGKYMKIHPEKWNSLSHQTWKRPVPSCHRAPWRPHKVWAQLNISQKKMEKIPLTRQGWTTPIWQGNSRDIWWDPCIWIYLDVTLDVTLDVCVCVHPWDKLPCLDRWQSNSSFCGLTTEEDRLLCNENVSPAFVLTQEAGKVKYCVLWCLMYVW